MASPAVDHIGFVPTLTGPNMPLRRPTTCPGGAPATPVSPRLLPSPQTLQPIAMNLAGGRSARRTLLLSASVVSANGRFLKATISIVMNLCNYCSKQGTFRCNGCIKTFYCSALCHNEDWKAHRHLCLSNTSKPEGETAKEVPSQQIMNQLPTVSAVSASDAAVCHRVYLVDLKKKNMAIGSEVTATVVELHSPGRFFVHVQCWDIADSLHKVGMALQNISSGLPDPAYLPDQGEVCAVQFSKDRKWYRGLVQSMSLDQKTASILYIDFGNEEDVNTARIRPLDPNLQPIPPCATECCVAGVMPVIGIWTGECCAAVKQLLAEKIVNLSVVGVMQSGRVHAVDFVVSSVGKRLSTFLVDRGYATQENVAAKRSENDIHFLVRASLENFKRRSTKKDQNTMVWPPEPLTQCVGDCFSALVTQVISPFNMICQKVENASVAQELQMNLRDHCSQSPVSLNFRPAPGTVCCSQFSDDNQWYRAQVLSYTSEHKVCVGYIDFGNSEDVALWRLRPLSAPLLALPMQAIPCALAGVRPIQETWSDQCVLLLQQMVCNRILSVRIVGRSNGAALVTMVDEASDPQADVAELLLSVGYAAPATSLPDQEAEDTAAPGAEGAAAAKEEAGKAPDSLVWSSVELPCDGPTVALMVTSVQDPGDFFCLHSEPKVYRRLEELCSELKQYCEREASPCQATVGQPCCALFPDDNCWYRALVKEVFEDKVLVYFVDYGNTAEVQKIHLRNLTAPHRSLPLQAIRCWLTGVEPLGPAWTSEALLSFHAMVSGQQLRGRALCLTERGYGVELMSGGQSVAAVLLAQKLARLPGQPAAAAAHQTPAAAVVPVVTASDARNASPVAAAKEPDAEAPELTTPAQNSARSPPREEPVQPAPTALVSFLVDWKPVELPRESFRPCVAAVTSPTLFYVLSPTQVEVECQQRMMMELAEYCSSRQASLRSSFSPGQERPILGAACCAQFSGDKNWYRAIVLETGEIEASVLFVDYGNCETVPYSSLHPIPDHLLRVPFQITRCSLTGKDRFPRVWPADVLMLFKSVLVDSVTATVHSFDGFTNQLSIMLPREMGGGFLDDLILSQLELLTRASPKKMNIQAITTKEVASPSTPTIIVGGPQPSTLTSPTTITHPPGGHSTSPTTITKPLGEHPTNPTTITKVLEEHPASPTTITKVLEGPPTSPTTITKVLGEHPTTITKVLEEHPASPTTITKMDRLERVVERHISVIMEMIGLGNI
ncbi:unnamed protein product [Lota lota]